MRPTNGVTPERSASKRLSQRRPGPRRSGDAFEVLGSEVVKLEEIAKESSRAVGDDDRIRRGDTLQARRQIGRLAHDPTFLSLPGADDVANHDQTRRDADADLERLLDAKLAHRFDERQSRPHRALGIVLVGLRIAKIHQHAVAHVFGNKPVESSDRLRDTLLIGADYKAHVLGIELRRERS